MELVKPVDESLPEPLPRKPPEARPDGQRVHEMEQDVAAGRLRPWMKAYAAWLCTQPKVPALPVRVKQARFLSRFRVPQALVVALEKTDTFLTCYETYAGDEKERALGVLQRHLEHAVEAHFVGLDMAIAEKDHRAIPNYTIPILDRVSPKKTEQEKSVAVVHITLGKPESFAARTMKAEDIADVEFEVVDGA